MTFDINDRLEIRREFFMSLESMVIFFKRDFTIAILKSHEKAAVEEVFNMSNTTGGIVS